MLELNDSLDDLLAGPMLPEPRKAPEAYYAAAAKLHSEPCAKCAGSGKFRGYSGRVFGDCFACKGKGKRAFKASAADRAKARASRANLKAERMAEGFSAWKAANPALWSWLDAASKRGNQFAAKLIAGIIKFGDLTEGQRAAVERIIAEDAAKAEHRAKADVEAPEVASEGVDRLKAAFDAAIAYAAERGLKKSPRITIGGITISPAKANSKNPGALYVKSGRDYLGKIAGGKLIASRECSDEQSAKVLAFVADPAAAAKVYGQETGTCCVCNATLRSEWRLRGIGPICAQKFGW